MPATTKQQLIDVTHLEYQKLEKLLADVKRSEALEKDDDGVSIKDVIGHRAHWIDLFFGWYEDGKAGKEVYFPAKGYKWNQLVEYNAALREKQSRLSWPKACAQLQAGHERISAFMAEMPAGDLYGGPMQGANNKWTIGRWAEAAGPSHYRSASKFIRARLKALRS